MQMAAVLLRGVYCIRQHHMKRLHGSQKLTGYVRRKLLSLAIMHCMKVKGQVFGDQTLDP